MTVVATTGTKLGAAPLASAIYSGFVAATRIHWHQRFDPNLEQVLALGYPQRFVRMWRYYLAYCEGGFMERSIGSVQMLLCKPAARPRQFLPDLDAVI